MARNPHERRIDSDLRGQEAMTHMFSVGGPAVGPRESPITMIELEAMVHQAHRRGRLDAEDAFPERERQARREAWDDGAKTGRTEGMHDLMAQIEGLHGKKVRDLIEQADQVRKRVRSRKATTREVADMLMQTTAMLAELVHSHHSGFDLAPDQALPF